MTSPQNTVAQFFLIRDRIAQSHKLFQPGTSLPTLIVVSKQFDATAIRPVLEAGHRCFGENRVQEAQGKWPELKKLFPDISLHLIGPLQTNKVKDAVAIFDVIETVDRPKLAKSLAEEMHKQGKSLPCFIQVNTGEEPQKAGISPSETEAFIHYCREDLHLPIVGLMCIPPVDDEPAPHFALLRTLAEKTGLKELSMGMSADYEIAVALGATYVRVGSAIFGDRNVYT
ncbi:MAG: YggS family pyridoxal phosphate-dependent enzyme [Hyphomicrobiales bacterium]|nr:YggS family pyridoxal phosphate-dependent enzyme [Hyphomicrobiales bacterium]